MRIPPKQPAVVRELQMAAAKCCPPPKPGPGAPCHDSFEPRDFIGARPHCPPDPSFPSLPPQCEPRDFIGQGPRIPGPIHREPLDFIMPRPQCPKGLPNLEPLDFVGKGLK